MHEPLGYHTSQSNRIEPLNSVVQLNDNHMAPLNAWSNMMESYMYLELPEK